MLGLHLTACFTDSCARVGTLLGFDSGWLWRSEDDTLMRRSFVIPVSHLSLSSVWLIGKTYTTYTGQLPEDTISAPGRRVDIVNFSCLSINVHLTNVVIVMTFTQLILIVEKVVVLSGEVWQLVEVGHMTHPRWIVLLTIVLSFVSKDSRVLVIVDRHHFIPVVWRWQQLFNDRHQITSTMSAISFRLNWLHFFGQKGNIPILIFLCDFHSFFCDC